MWGENESGQLGDGTTENRYEPVKIILGDGGTTSIPGQVTHYYGATQTQPTSAESVYIAARTFTQKMDSYFTAVQGAASTEATRNGGKQQPNKAQELKKIDDESSVEIISFGGNMDGTNIPQGVVDAAYAVLADYFDMMIDTGIEDHKIDMSQDVISVSADMIEYLRSRYDFEHVTGRAGGYTVKMDIVTEGFWPFISYVGNMTVRGNGVNIPAAVVSSPDQTAKALEEYVNVLADWTQDAVREALNSLATELVDVTYIGDFTKREMRNMLEDSVDSLKSRGFGNLLDYWVTVREGYDIVKPILSAGVFGDEADIAKALKNADEIRDELLELALSDGDVTQKAVQQAMSDLNTAKGNLCGALLNYVTGQEQDKEEDQGFFDWLMSFFCPINVTVLDPSGNVMAGIEDGQATDNGSARAEVYGDVKRISMPTTPGATVKIEGTDYGSMTFVIEQLDGNGAPVGRYLYEDVPLSNGSVHTFTAPSGDFSTGSVPSLESDTQQEIPGRFISATDGNANVSVSTATSGPGLAAGAGTYPIGDMVSLSAIKEEDGDSFEGWFVNGELVCASSEYLFPALEDVTVEARFETERTIDESIDIAIADRYQDVLSAFAYVADGARNDIALCIFDRQGIDEPVSVIVRSYGADGEMLEEDAASTVKDGSYRYEIRGLDLATPEWVEILTADGYLIATIGTPVTPTKPSDPSIPSDPDDPATPDDPSHDETCPSKAFSDVDTTQWYHAAVDWALEAGAMNGYENGTFGPIDPLTREQAAAVLWNLLGDKDATAPAAKHADVDQGAWYADAVNWAVEHGYMNGYDGSDRFGVGDALTREQFACVIANVAEADLDEADPSAMEKLPDAGEVSSWAEAAVAWAVQEGVINGVETEDGRELQPGRTISRAEMAAMMMNAVDKGALEIE